MWEARKKSILQLAKRVKTRVGSTSEIKLLAYSVWRKPIRLSTPDMYTLRTALLHADLP
jgi:hypothetical protein